MSESKGRLLLPASRRTVMAGAAVLMLSGTSVMAAAHSNGARALRPWFEAYLAAFNRRDFAGFGAYYADDVQFHGQAATLAGRDAVLDFYRKVGTYLNERVELLTFIGAPDGSHILAELRTTLVAHRDWPDMPTGPMPAGTTRQSVNFVMYDIVGERFTRVRSARFSPQRGQKS